MTQEQKQKIEDMAVSLKKILPDFYGSVTFNLSGSKKDVKIEVKDMSIVKT